MKSAYHHRLRLVAHARQHGIKPDRWLVSDYRPPSARVAAPFSAAGAARSHRAFRAPHHQPRKTPADIEQVIALRQQLFTFSPQPFLATFANRLASVPGS